MPDLLKTNSSYLVGKAWNIQLANLRKEKTEH